MLSEEEIKKYIKAGKIAAEVIERTSGIIKPGERLIKICDYAEKLIVELGGKPAFPCNISVDHIAAHYSPLWGDQKTVPENSLVKLDIGVHVDGYIADTAITVSFDENYEDLLEAVREALNNAIKLVAPGRKFSEIGKVVEQTIKKYGFKPISNLSGHSLARYIIHAGESIPNTFSIFALGSFKKGRAYAIEPFGTDGAGYVVEEKTVTIYALRRLPGRRKLSKDERLLLNTIYERYRTLPFSERWLVDLMQPEELRRMLQKLARKGFLIGYPVLVERGRGKVAQFEHTILVLENQVLVTTLRE